MSTKPRPLTTPQQRILDAFLNADGPLATSSIRVASTSYTNQVVRLLHEDMKLIHIAAWRRGGKNNNGFYPLYLHGNLPDVSKPIASAAELRRRKNERQRRQMAEQRAACRVPADMPPPPPALPTYTPRYGFWRI